MKYFKVVSNQTGKTVANDFSSKSDAKEARNALNLEAGYKMNEDDGRGMPFKVTKDVEHPKY